MAEKWEMEEREKVPEVEECCTKEASMFMK